MIAATDKNIEWLIERLYFASRELQAHEVNDPTFVLLTKGVEDRHRVEKVFFDYFRRAFACDAELSFKEYVDCTHMTAFSLPNLRARIMLMDI